MNQEILLLIERAKQGDSSVFPQLEHWKSVMKLDPVALALIISGLNIGQRAVLDEELSYALAKANGGRGILTLTQIRIAKALLDFLEKPYYKEKLTHWIIGGDFRAKDSEETVTTLFVVMRDGANKLSIKITNSTKENLESEIGICGLISCSKSAAKLWANWILTGE